MIGPFWCFVDYDPNSSPAVLDDWAAEHALISAASPSSDIAYAWVGGSTSTSEYLEPVKQDEYHIDDSGTNRYVLDTFSYTIPEWFS